jgi:hypothetical protein
VKQGDATATPKYEDEQLTWQTTDFSESWNVHFMIVNPACDTQYVEEELLSWACDIADKEQIWLRATWPVETADSLIRAGFLYSCLYFSELTDRNGNDQMLGTMKMCRGPKKQTPPTPEKSSSSSDGGEEEISTGPFSGTLPN